LKMGELTMRIKMASIWFQMMRARMTDLVRSQVPDQLLNADMKDLQHHLLLLNYDGKLFICPMDKDKQIHRVLDVGTGTGIWAIDYGEPQFA